MNLKVVFIKAVVGGHCSSPGECVCQDGYTGVNCESGTWTVMMMLF